MATYFTMSLLGHQGASRQQHRQRWPATDLQRRRIIKISNFKSSISIKCSQWLSIGKEGAAAITRPPAAEILVLLLLLMALVRPADSSSTDSKTVSSTFDNTTVASEDSWKYLVESFERFKRGSGHGGGKSRKEHTCDDSPNKNLCLPKSYSKFELPFTDSVNVVEIGIDIIDVLRINDKVGTKKWHPFCCIILQLFESPVQMSSSAILDSKAFLKDSSKWRLINSKSARVNGPNGLKILMWFVTFLICSAQLWRICGSMKSLIIN